MLISSICDSLCSMKNLSWRTAFAFLLIEDCCDRHEQCLVSSVCPFFSSIGVLAPVAFVRISYILLAMLSAMRANKKKKRQELFFHQMYEHWSGWHNNCCYKQFVFVASLWGTLSSKRINLKTYCKWASHFCQNRQVVSKNVFFWCLHKKYWVFVRDFDSCFSGQT